jgi:hypothetical protein
LFVCGHIKIKIQLRKEKKNEANRPPTSLEMIMMQAYFAPIDFSLFGHGFGFLQLICGQRFNVQSKIFI